MHAPAVPARQFNRTAIVQFVIVTLIWGGTWSVIRTQLGVVPPSWSVAYRFLLGGGIMLLTCIVARRSLAIGRRGHVFALTAGLFQFSLNFNLVYRAEQYIASGLVALLFALLVVPNSIIGWTFLRQRITRQFALGSAIGIAGVALLFAHDLAAPAAGGNLRLGLLLGAASILCASISNVMQASPTGRSLPFEGTLAISMLYGAAMNIVAALWLSGPPVFDLSLSYIAGLLYLGIMASAVAFSLYFSLIRSIGPAAAAYTGVLVPVLALALSTGLEGYVWAWPSLLGTALALAGLLVALRSKG